MSVYVDVVLFLNFVFDFLILLTTSIVLRRKTKMFNLLLGAFIGSLSIIILFLNINSIQLFIIKVYLSILMNLFCFYYKDFKYTITNIGVFYVVSILLGGFLYLLNLEFSYKNSGLIFYYNGLSINVIFLFILSPIILYIYIRQAKIFQRKISNYYNVNLFLNDKKYSLTGYLDSGNCLVYEGRPVIFINCFSHLAGKKILVPYSSVGFSGFVCCVEAKIEIEKLGYYDVLLGISNNIKISGVDVLLNNKMEAK